MNKDVVVWAGAGQIGTAIARRIGYGKKIVVGDLKIENAEAIAKTMNDAGFDVAPVQLDLSNRESIKALISKAQEFGPIVHAINAAGVSPSQAPVETKPFLRLTFTELRCSWKKLGALSPKEVPALPSLANQVNACRSSATKSISNLLARPPKICLTLRRSSPKTSSTRFMPTNWPSVATKNA